MILCFAFFSDVKEGNYPAMLMNHRNHHHGQNVFQVAPKSEILFNPYGVFFQFFFISPWEKTLATLLTVAMDHENLYYHTA